MADNFGLKIGLEGEKEFKNSLAEINQSFKVLGSEMKLVESQFDKNDKSVEALTARNDVLGKQIEAQKEKIQVLRAALKNAADSFGENDKRTQAWQIQLNNAEAALNGMERELKSIMRFAMTSCHSRRNGSAALRSSFCSSYMVRFCRIVPPGSTSSVYHDFLISAVFRRNSTNVSRRRVRSKYRSDVPAQ